MNKTMTVFIDGKSETRKVTHMEQYGSIPMPQDVPELHRGEDMMRTVTGEVHIFKKFT